MNRNSSKNLPISDWQDDDLVAQCAVFFFAGFETNSSALCFLAHELACNPEIQQKLHDEITAADSNSGESEVTFETIKNCKYLDMVASETLRLWPPVSQLDRQVTKPYWLEGTGHVVELTTRDAIYIPIYALHTDSTYWPEPNHFNPERFNDENRQNIHNGTYLPFGYGQRTCIASRFAFMLVKTLFFHLIREFRIEKCDKTSDPIVLTSNSINMHAKNGFWVQFQSRHSVQGQTHAFS